MDEISTTFIVYRNQSPANGFNSTGHLYPGSSPAWSVEIALSSKQTEGNFTYHLFMVTFDPEGIVGTYQVRINLTGTVTGGSNWTSPDGNPRVPWMFFQVPEGTSFPISVSDQLSRYSPFFFDTPYPSTYFNATLVVEPPGNYTGATTSRIRWNHTNGTTISEFNVPVYYVGGGRWASQGIIAADNSTFPANFTHPYRVDIQLGSFERSGTFYVYPIHAAIRPQTWLTGQPPAQQENTTAEFSWIGSDLDGNVIGYEYMIDSGSWVETTETSTSFFGLQNGSHRFDVRSIDDDGLIDNSPAYGEFLVIINSPPGTVITRAPNATSSSRDVYFEWQGSDVDGTVVSYGYRLDGGQWVNTTMNNLTLLNLTSGNHTFQVRSVDNRGLEDPSPAQADFAIPLSWCEREIERLNDIIDYLQGRVSELESIISNLTELLQLSEDHNRILCDQIEELEEDKDALLAQIAHLAEEKANLISQLTSLAGENAALDANLTACQELMASLQQQVEGLNQTIKELMEDNSQLELENGELLSTIEDLQERIRELELLIPEATLALLASLAATGLVMFRPGRGRES
jgi:regulator of replication initiation timing